MAIEIRLPKEVELKIKGDKELEGIVKTKIEQEISKEIKKDVFLSMLYDKLLDESELTEKDVNEIDHIVKKDIMETLGWS